MPDGHTVAEVVAVDLLAELLHEVRPLGAGADQRHLASQHVDQLRQLVEVRRAQEPADAGDPVVLVCTDHWVVESSLTLMVRNLRISKGRPPTPMRTWRKNTGPGAGQLHRRAHRRPGYGAVSRSSSAAGDHVEGPLGRPQAGGGSRDRTHRDQRQARSPRGRRPRPTHPARTGGARRRTAPSWSWQRRTMLDQLLLVRPRRRRGRRGGRRWPRGSRAGARGDPPAGSVGVVLEAVDETARDEAELGVVLERLGDLDADGAGADDEGVLEVVATVAWPARPGGS